MNPRLNEAGKITGGSSAQQVPVQQEGYQKQANGSQQQVGIPVQRFFEELLQVPGFCFLIESQIASISCSVMSASGLPCARACCSMPVNRDMNFLLVFSSAFSASTCKNRA